MSLMNSWLSGAQQLTQAQRIGRGKSRCLRSSESNSLLGLPRF
jgi:hypothetical protein